MSYTNEAKIGKSLVVLLARLGGRAVFTAEETEKFSLEELERRGADLKSEPQDDGTVLLTVTFDRD